jgi:hypothetical protein
LHSDAGEFSWRFIEDYGTAHDTNIFWENEIWTYEPEHIKVYFALHDMVMGVSM